MKRLMSWIKKLLHIHEHEFTNKLTVSGYGYTEYEIWFCKWCDKVFGKQTKNFN